MSPTSIKKSACVLVFSSVTENSYEVMTRFGDMSFTRHQFYVTGTHYTFHVKVCSDARVLLSAKPFVDAAQDGDVVDIVFGASHNMRTVINKGQEEKVCSLEITVYPPFFLF